jgi:hypothetical protein
MVRNKGRPFVRTAIETLSVATMNYPPIRNDS